MALTPLIGEGRLRVTQEAAFEPADTRSWFNGAVVFEHRHWACGEAELSWMAPSHLIVLTQSGRTAKTRISCAGELIHDGVDRPGVLSFIPAGVERSGFYQAVDLVYSALWLDPARMDLGEPGRRMPPILINRSDNVVGALLSGLQAELAGGIEVEASYVEHLVAVLLHRFELLDGGGSSRRGGHGPIPKAAFRRVQEHIDAHLCHEITLGELARLAGMGHDSFARRFRATTGIAPYAYVIEQRMRRAEELLVKSDLDLARVACALGFSSQSHFTTTFRRQRGLTPLAYRRQRSS
jgi:AraC family transcriptional regulator